MSFELVKLDQARQLLADCNNIQEVKGFYDMAETYRHYAKIQGLSLESANHATELKIRAERIMGEMLKSTPKNGGGRPQKTGMQGDTSLDPLTLSEIGLTKTQSSRFQSVASIPAEIFERHIAETTGGKKELTSAGMQKLAKDIKNKESYGQKREEVIPDSANHILADVRHATLEQLGGIPFKAIILDPAWEFEAWDQKTGDEKSPEYDLMTTDDIYNLPIARLADDDCLLLLWATNPFLPQALRAMETYGFIYRTKFPWIKTTLKNQMLDYGTGYWVRGVSEDVLIGVRGNISAPRYENFLGLIGPNIEHSRKPQDVHKMAESTTKGPYLELFARYSHSGWTTVGSEYRGEQPPDPIPSACPPWLSPKGTRSAER
jgi:N6-adenosine-specific RNA methylase IME4